MNVWDIVIIAAVGAGIFLAVRHTRNTRKSGGCNCGCEGCTKQCGKK